MKSMRWRIILVAVLSAWALYSIVPTVIYFSLPKEVRNDAEQFKQKIPAGFPKDHIKLGLDLQGGVQLVLGVEAEGAVENKLQRVGVETMRWVEESKKVKVQEAYVTKGSRLLTIVLPPEQSPGDFKAEFLKEFPGLQQVKTDVNKYYFNYTDDHVKSIKKSALEQAERVVRSRIDKWGVAEPIINRRADGSVLVQLPGFKDPGMAKELLGRTAQLKFKIVDDTFNGFDAIKNNLPAGVTLGNNGAQVAFIGEDRDVIKNFAQSAIPADRELLFKREDIAGGKKSKWTTYVVMAATELTGDDVFEANVSTNSSNGIDNRPAVSLQFTGPGGKRFADITGKNIKKRMAIVLDDVVQSDPVINEKISGGSASISLGQGNFDEVMKEANQLALILKSGAIPADITVLEERQVGASLGPELANQGIKGALVGFACIFIFIVGYYRRPGLISGVALGLNGLFLLAVMGNFGFALTLPGIAGFVLTLGMAVDANVLINERITQELASGKNAKKAMETAFDKVTWTILDSNITSLIAAFVLLETNSSGPIRGFAVTLMIGLFISLFTSLTCTRLFFEMAILRQTSDAKIRAWLGERDYKVFNFNYLKQGPKFVGLYLVICVLVLGTSFTKGINWGVDFAGGTEVMVSFSEDTEVTDIDAAAEKAGISSLTAQALDGGKQKYLLHFEAQNDAGKDAKAMAVFEGFKNNLMTDLAAKKPEVQSVNFVGPQIGTELRNQGIQSLFWAILGIFAYILLRFDLRFGPGAVAKMVLDTMVMSGFYVFLSRTFDLTSVAALLTVIGYSVNDTIVVYDRIRENIVEKARKSFGEIINASINETLARSLNTSIVTAVSLFGMLIFGTGQIWDFAMAMLIGVIVVTVSTTFIASTFVAWFESWNLTRTKSAVVKS